MVTGTKKTERHGLEASVLSGSPTGTSKSGCEPAVGPEEHFGIVASELVAPRGDSGDGTNLLVGFSGWPDSRYPDIPQEALSCSLPDRARFDEEAKGVACFGKTRGKRVHLLTQALHRLRVTRGTQLI